MRFVNLLPAAAALLLVSCTTGKREMNFQGNYLFDVAPNEELYGDMLLHCDNFIAEVSDPAVKEEVRDFVSSVNKSHKKDSCAWIGETFDFVDHMKAEYPPVVASVYEPSEEALVRKNIMMLLDFPMHSDEKSADAEPAVVASYPHARNVHMLNTQEKLIEWLNLPAPAENEIMVAKVYSSGILFRTKDHMLALDVRWQGSEDEANAICSKADMFVLTHNHNDHYSLNILERMMLMGKPVLVPSNNFYETGIKHSLATYDGPNKHLWEGPIGTYFPAEKIGPATIEARMAAQGDVPCLLYMIDFDGWRIAATGDNSYCEYQECFEGWEAPDFICTPLFQNFKDIMGRVAKAPNPNGRESVYFPIHENEMHHGVSHRVGYRFLYHSGAAFGGEPFDHFTPYVLLDGGEGISFTRKQ